MKTVLTIAGFDPSSGAGTTADLMVFAAHGLFGVSCITALTVQSTQGVQSIHSISDEIVAATLKCLDEDIEPVGIKIGMIFEESKVFTVCSYLDILKARLEEHEEHFRIPVILDPVQLSSSGRELLDPPGVTAMRENLLPAVDWITPNVDELAVLTGRTIAVKSDIPFICNNLQETIAIKDEDGSRLGIIVTGGDHDPPDDFIQLPSGEGHWLPGERVTTTSTHGTGCAFSSAFLSRLVLGELPLEAARGAKAYVAGALSASQRIGKGRGPMNHLWNLRKPLHQVL